MIFSFSNFKKLKRKNYKINTNLFSLLFFITFFIHLSNNYLIGITVNCLWEQNKNYYSYIYHGFDCYLDQWQ